MSQPLPTSSEAPTQEQFTKLLYENWRLRQQLESWRAWAQFVFLGGGPIVGDDDVLREAVCAAFDRKSV